MFVTGRLFYQTLIRKNPKSFDKSIYFTAIVKKPLHSWSHLIKQLINARTVSDFFFMNSFHLPVIQVDSQ